MPLPLETHIAEVLRQEARPITEQWVSALTDRLQVDRGDALPKDSILDHIPDVLGEIANYISNPEEDLLDDMIREDLTLLADLRRAQGHAIAEILAEFRILSELIDARVAAAIEAYAGELPRADIVRLVSRVKSAIYRLGAETAARFRTWDRRESQDRIRILGGYTEMLSHELSNRLGAAETAVRLLLESEKPLPPDRIERLHELILASLKSGMETVQGVLVLAGADREGSTERRTLPLSSIVRDAVQQMRLHAADRGIEIHLASAGPAEPIDAERLPLALFNLVTNAVRHHDVPDGQGKVVVDVVEDDDACVITVEDDGPGIPPHLRDTLFQPRVQGREGSGGSGLGLAIARAAIRQMGGEISLESTGDRGTTFRVTLPGRPPSE